MSQRENSSSGKAGFAIEGELTIYRAAELKDVIYPHINHADVIEIDLSRVSEIDSAGLQLLVSAKLEAMIRDKQLHLVGHSKPVQEMLDLCDLGGFFGDQIVIFSHPSH
ncbi:STAS domain-containing protein [Sideroxydans lithotrophicus]|uniref:Anti-sigma-factor antagonist n=1 Tax=Sideroxydans lithotrophicus (strain ES-1) TaxID=580332 RepID=D5CS86_SIDLE|nr:STAS domain-containing protein [Sideroxydans lithotrophicus]ADE11822.1 anti-sigma-factor antagonist [Sideroxydans lithotrophicus ES-1]